MRLRAVLLISVLLAGWLTGACASATEKVAGPSATGSPSSIPPVVSPTPPTAEGCDAPKAQWAVGERASDELLERARVAAKAAVARFLRPNQRVTMEYLGARLNLALNGQDIVRAVTCG